MALETTVGQLMVNEVLPEEFRDYHRTIDKKTLAQMLRKLALTKPEEYRKVSFELGKLGRDFAYTTGGYSFGVKHLLQSPTARANRQKLQEQIRAILDDDKLDEKTRNERIVVAAGRLQSEESKQLMAEGLAEKNPFAMQIVSGSRGNPTNLAGLRGSDLLYMDHRDRVIPLAVVNSYSRGLTPAEYWAASYGARKGVIDVKAGTRDAGYVGKQLAQASHRLVVVDTDRDGEPDTIRGLPVDVDDEDNEGALLAADIGGYKKNTILTPKILSRLAAQGVKRLLVRSPVASSSPDGGLYARDVGVREFGRLPERGENPGMAAANALAEPISQSALCLAMGTRVRLANGGYRRIEDVLVGDVVLGADKRGRTFPVLVTAIYVNGMRPCYEYSFGNSQDNKAPISVTCTEDHKFLLRTDVVTGDRAQREATVSAIGRQITALHAVTTTQGALPLVNIQYVGMKPTYDIEVEHQDHLFVLDCGLITSNSSKHTGGVAGAANRAVSGFELIDSLLQIPKTFKGGAAHAEVDGEVEAVSPAPAGGFHVRIGGQDHYVNAGYTVSVKKGDKVEAGDVLSDGIPNPSKIVQHKGVGEGRRYFAWLFRKSIKDSGLRAHRRNTELLARGLINHVRLTDEIAGGVPDDVLPYDYVEHRYQPRPGHVIANPKSALGLYLEKPYLHYTVGTKIKPSMLKDFEDFKIPELVAHKDPPPFEPEMIRAAATLQHDPDWMVRMYGSGLKSSVLEAARRNASSSETGTSFVPALARGVDFGRVGVVKTPKSAPPLSVLDD